MNVNERIRLEKIANSFKEFCQKFEIVFSDAEEDYIDIIEAIDNLWHNEILIELNQSTESNFLANLIASLIESTQDIEEMRDEPDLSFYEGEYAINPYYDQALNHRVKNYKNRFLKLYKSNIASYLNTLEQFGTTEKKLDSDNTPIERQEKLTRNQKVLLLHYLQRFDKFSLNKIHQDTKHQVHILAPLLELSPNTLATALRENTDTLKKESNNLQKLLNLFENSNKDFDKLKEEIISDMKKLSKGP